MFLGKITSLKIWLNPELTLTIFRGTGPCCLLDAQREHLRSLVFTYRATQIQVQVQGFSMTPK